VARILELGCGPRPAEGTTIGVDLDISEARAAAGAGIGCVVGRAERLPFAAGTADGVLARGMMHHVTDFGGVLAEVRRVLLPGGTFTVIDAQPMAPEEFADMTRQLAERGHPTEPGTVSTLMSWRPLPRRRGSVGAVRRAVDACLPAVGG
jgi:ubiquinone/menaquinone biosynthesis C-methylase UbiE